MSDIKYMTVLGEPKLDIEGLYPTTEINYAYAIEELIPEGDLDDVDKSAHALIGYARNGGRLYVCASMRSGAAKKILDAVTKVLPDFVIDEALELLHAQTEGEPLATPEDFIDALNEGAAEAGLLVGRMTAEFGDEDGEVVFYEQYRENRKQRVKFGTDGIVELNGAVLRNVAIIGAGHFHDELLGGRILTPSEVLRFIANRVSVNGPDELCGYGRAFGPSKDDVTNATLSTRSREFRANGFCGVVAASAETVYKAKPEMVVKVGKLLRKRLTDKAASIVTAFIKAGLTGREHDLVAMAMLGDTDALTVLEAVVTMHQQCKELYTGFAACVAFRLRVWLDEKGVLILEAYGKSSKHWRVDAGAYCLYTEAGDGFVEVPALLGQFEESNDGSIYAPKKLMRSHLRGYLKESVIARKDFRTMSDEVMAKYQDAEIRVIEGDTVYPGDVVMTCDGQEFIWESKADWGTVTRVIAEMNTIDAKFAHYEVRIDAWFESEAKIRAFGKGLVCPSEAAGVSFWNTSGGVLDPALRMLIGVPGIVKDSAAAIEYIVNPEPCVATVKTVHCETSYEAMKRKHMPDETTDEFEDDEDPMVTFKTYPDGVTVTFDDRDHTITTMDPNAIRCTIRCCIEASPVAQSVGSSGLTMPQIGFLASFEAGNAWLCEQLLPGVRKRVRTLGYFHAVAGMVDMNGSEEAVNDDDDVVALTL